MTTPAIPGPEAALASVPARMDRIPIVRTHIRATIVIGIGLFFDIYEIFLSGTLSGVLKKEFGMGGTGLTWLLASSFFGMFIGAIAIGRVADRFGRRKAFLASLAIYSVFTLVGAFSQSVLMLVASRFIAGIGIGAEPPVSDAYLGDILPPRKRGLFTGIAYTLSFIGVPVVGFLGHWLVPRTPFGIDGWRWMFVFGAVGAVIVFFLRRSLPESPRWLSATGREDEAREIVTSLEAEAQAKGLVLPAPDTSTPSVTPGGTVKELLSPRLRVRVGMMYVFHFFQSWGYYGFGTLVPVVLALHGFSIVKSLGFLGWIYIGYPVGAALSLPIIEAVERKWLVVAAGLGMAASGIAFGFAREESTILILGFIYTAISNVFSNAFHVYQAEIFPTRLRATAASSAYSLSRLSSGFMPFILLPLLEHHGANALFAAVAVAMVICTGAIAWFGPSATGLTLTELNAATLDGVARPVPAASGATQ